MANIMDMVKLRNHPSRNGFDLSHSRKFSAKVGQLLPCLCKPVLPFDSFTIDVKSFTRTQSINTAAFARMREYVDFYFVPMEQMWNKQDSAITQMLSNVQHASGPKLSDNFSLSGDFPYITCQQIAEYIHELVNDTEHDYNTTLFGFSRAHMTVTLLSYLGYGDFSMYLDKTKTWSTNPMPFNEKKSVFPLFAYQKVYADFFRYTQWEKPNPSSFNCDYIKGNACQLDLTDLQDDFNMFDLRFDNLNKDLFFGLLPNAQYGDTAYVPLLSDTPSLGVTELDLYFGKSVGPSLQPLTSDATIYTSYDGTLKAGKSTSSTLPVHIGLPNANLQPILKNMLNDLSILALRRQEAAQRWKEISQSVDEDYAKQIEAHWGVSVSQYLSHQCRYLGGTATSLDINPIVNQNLTGENPEARLTGLGTFASNGKIQFESKGEYGYIIGIYHVKPLFDYCCGQVDPVTNLTSAQDFPLPEFDRIGMEQIPASLLYNLPKDAVTQSSGLELFFKQHPFLGYAPRYVTWKTSIDVCLGAFANKEKSWVLPFDASNLARAMFPDTWYSDNEEDVTHPNVPSTSAVNWWFMKCDPHLVDNLFLAKADDTYDTDHLRVNMFLDIKAVRSLDVDGLPY